MIEPLLKDDAFLDDVRTACSETDRLHLWWLGQSGFLLKWQQQHVLIDPYLSDSLTKKYAETDKPHVRMTGRVIDPEQLNFIDVVTSSHNHTDHLDAETLLPLFRVNAGLTLVVPEANRQFAADRLGMDPTRFTGLDDNTSHTVKGVEFTGIASAHEDVKVDESGHHCYLGYVIKLGPYRIYHSGDTLRYPGLAESVKPHRVDVALLPINGRAPERRVAGNLDGIGAARLAYEMDARHCIPCHYEMFEFNTASPDAFVSEAQRLGLAHTVLQNGQRWSC